MTKKVYILNDGGHDYSDAQRYGTPIICTGNIIRKDDTAQMYRELMSALADADAEDYLLVSSLSSMCMVAAGIMVDRFGELHLLLFKDGQYVSRDIFFESRSS